MNISLSTGKFKKIVSEFSALTPILVIGDVGIDKYTQGVVRRISPEAPVPLVEVRKEWFKLGLAANVIDNLKSLGINSTLCGVIGDDQNANSFELLLEENNIGTEGIVRCDERPTVFKERIVTEIQQICRIDYESKKPISRKIEKKLFSCISASKDKHASLIIEDYSKGTFTDTLICKIIKEYKDSGKIIAVDPSRTTPPIFYKGVTLLKPNRDESELMVKSLGYNNVNSIEEIISILIEKLELEKLVITLGAKGMVLVDTKVSDEIKYIPTVASEVYDVSGAGDTAISLLVSSLQAGATLEEAAWISNCGSGIVIGKRGTATVTQSELIEYFSYLKKTKE